MRGEVGGSWGRGNYKQNIVYEKNKLSIGEKIKKHKCEALEKFKFILLKLRKLNEYMKLFSYRSTQDTGKIEGRRVVLS